MSITIELRKEPYEVWTILKEGNAFDADGHLDIAKFYELSGRMNDLRGLINKGVIVQKGPLDFRKTRGVRTVQWVEKVVSKGVPDDDDDVDTKAVVASLTPIPKGFKLPNKRLMPSREELIEKMKPLMLEQRMLLYICMENTNWDYGLKTYRIKTADIRAQYPVYKTEDVIELLANLGIPSSLHNHSFPAYMKGAALLSDGTLRFCE